MNYNMNRCNPCPMEQRHVHEIIGSVEIAERNEDPHNHRFASITDEEIPSGSSHVHNVFFRTDFYEGHFHEFTGTTLTAIPVGDGRHIHFLRAITGQSDGHRHEFRVATLIDNPIAD